MVGALVLCPSGRSEVWDLIGRGGTAAGRDGAAQTKTPDPLGIGRLVLGRMGGAAMRAPPFLVQVLGAVSWRLPGATVKVFVVVV